VALDVSTLADWVGAATATLAPMVAAIRAHVFAAGRLHADDTTVPVLAKDRTVTGRLWAYVRDDRPFAGPDPPAAVFAYDRTGAHPERHLDGWTGVMQADAYAGFLRLYDPARRPGPVQEAACWAHPRRGFFDLAKLGRSPIAVEAVARIDRLFAAERDLNGRPAEERRAERARICRPLTDDLHDWLTAQRRRLSGKSEPAKAIDYVLERWPALTLFLDDGRVCLSNNAAERALRGIAVGRGNWTFCGSDAGGERAAAIYTLIETAKLNGVDPQAWLADLFARLPDHPASRIGDLLPWNWKAPREQIAA
jgi:transposase